MLQNKTVAVVVPVYNEVHQIKMVIETIPDFVDRIVIVNDCSNDGTLEVLNEIITNQQKSHHSIAPANRPVERSRYNEAEFLLYEMDSKDESLFTPAQILNKQPELDRIIVISHTVNGGVGAAIASGYRWCKIHNIHCTAVMAGDGQMDPSELEKICRPIIDEGIDYVKGNRLIHRSAWLVIPRLRYFGNSILSILTKVASGYWHVSDTQTGYTAISLKALKSIRLHKIYKRYGMPNDMLVKLNIAFCTIREVEIKPIYRVGEVSKMKIWKVIPTVSLLLIKAFFQRLWIKYFFRDFHPLFLLYNFSFIVGFWAFLYFLKICKRGFSSAIVNDMTYFAFVFLFITSFISALFAMWMDIQDNERLYK